MWDEHTRDLSVLAAADGVVVRIVRGTYEYRLEQPHACRTMLLLLWTLHLSPDMRTLVQLNAPGCPHRASCKSQSGKDCIYTYMCSGQLVQTEETTACSSRCMPLLIRWPPYLVRTGDILHSGNQIVLAHPELGVLTSYSHLGTLSTQCVHLVGSGAARCCLCCCVAVRVGVRIDNILGAETLSLGASIKAGTKIGRMGKSGKRFTVTGHAPSCGTILCCSCSARFDCVRGCM